MAVFRVFPARCRLEAFDLGCSLDAGHQAPAKMQFGRIGYGYRTRDPLVGAVLAPLALSSFRAAAQELYPSSREIRVICGYAPGTGADSWALFHRAAAQAHQPDDHRREQGRRRHVDRRRAWRAPSRTATRCSSIRATEWPAIRISIRPSRTTCSMTLRTSPRWSNSRSAGGEPESPARSVKELLALIKEKGDKASYGYPNNISLCGRRVAQGARRPQDPSPCPTRVRPKR